MINLPENNMEGKDKVKSDIKDKVKSDIKDKVKSLSSEFSGSLLREALRNSSVNGLDPPTIGYDELPPGNFYIILRENKKPITNFYSEEFDEERWYNLLCCGMGRISEIKKTKENGYKIAGEDRFPEVAYLGLIDRDQLTKKSYITSPAKLCTLYHFSGDIYIKKIYKISDILKGG